MTAADHQQKPPVKKTKGKLKIEMKKIEKDSSRHVTFSKRRSGLFKKANELAVSTGCQVGILVESVSGKHIFSFGNPDVDSVVARFEKSLLPVPVTVTATATATDTSMGLTQEEFDTICKGLELEVVVQAEKKEENKGEGNFWWNRDVSAMDDCEELEKHLAALQLLKKNVMKKAEDLKVVEDQSKSTSTAAATSVSGGDYCGVDHQPPPPSSNAPPAIGGGIDQVVEAVDDVSGAHEELDLELRL